MRIFVTGATGFIGRALVPRLQRDGHTIVAWARSATRARALLGADVEIVTGALGGPPAVEALGRSDGIVNLAGEPIVGKRWTPARRARLEQSRVGLTEQLIDAMAAAGMRRGVLVSGSAVGYYGDRGDESLTESSAHGDDFLARLCIGWESAARKAENLGARVVLLRTGVVLGRAGGALAQMLPPFRVGLGGPVGSGAQFVSWIGIDDLVGAIHHAIVHDELAGAVNAVGPEPVRNRELAAAIGRTLHRPAIVPVPAAVLRLALGEVADELLLSSAHVVPLRLAAAGYRFRTPDIDAALSHVLGA